MGRSAQTILRDGCREDCVPGRSVHQAWPCLPKALRALLRCGDVLCIRHLSRSAGNWLGQGGRSHRRQAGSGPWAIPPASHRLHFAEAVELLSQASCLIVERGRQAVARAPRRSGGCQLPVVGLGEGRGEEQSPHSRWCSPKGAAERECPLSYSGLGPYLTWFCSETGPWGLGVYQSDKYRL